MEMISGRSSGVVGLSWIDMGEREIPIADSQLKIKEILSAFANQQSANSSKSRELDVVFSA
jgi:hypothetical protein